MSRFQPLIVPGATFFFTVRLQDPNAKLLTTQIDLLRLAMRACRQVAPFHIGATVVLPNRLHTIWTLPPEDLNYAKRWKMIKTTFSRHARLPRGTKTAGLWQRRYWECPINTPADMALYQGVIRQAAVDDGLVKRAEDWPFCTIPLSPDQASKLDTAA